MFQKEIDEGRKPKDSEVAERLKDLAQLQDVSHAVIANRILYEHANLEVLPPTSTESLSDKIDRLWETETPSSKTVICKQKYLWSEEDAKIIRKSFSKFMEAPQRPRKQEVAKAWSESTGIMKVIWDRCSADNWRVKCVEKVRTEWGRLQKQKKS